MSPRSGSARTRRPRVTALVPVLLATALVVTGCSGSDDASGSRSAGPGASTSASATSSATSSATASATPTSRAAEVAQPPAVPAAKRGPAGQRAFARHVMAVWGYGLRTDDARPLTSLAAAKAPCGGCRAYATSLRTRKKQHWSVDFAGLEVRKVVLEKQPAGATLARATVDIPESDSYTSDGTYRNTSKAHRGARFEVLMRWTAKRYRLVAFTIS